jgi:predicted metal-dependent peptidase
MWQHMSRGKKYHDTGFEGQPFDARLWNIAGDYVINDLLVESKIGKMPAVGLHDRAKGTSVEMVDDVYRKLLKDPNVPKGGGFDIHILDPGSANGAEWKRAIKTAADAAKAMGKLPDSLKRFVDQLLNPTIPWQEKLRHHVTRAIGRDAHTWAKPNRRRLINQGIIMPSNTGYGAGHVVVAVDTSGSVGQKELTVFMTELQQILDTSKPKAVTVLAIDAAVHDVTELNPNDSLLDNMPPLKGGGGTSFRPAFEWCHKEGVEPAALVYFTDMYGDFPEEAPAYPVIWCATTDHEGPWGETVRVDLKQYSEVKEDDDE